MQVAHEAAKNGLSCYCLKPSAVFRMPPLFALPEAVVNFEEPLTEAYIFKLNLRAVHLKCAQRYKVSTSSTSPPGLADLFTGAHMLRVLQAAAARFCEAPALRSSCAVAQGEQLGSLLTS